MNQRIRNFLNTLLNQNEKITTIQSRPRYILDIVTILTQEQLCKTSSLTIYHLTEERKKRLSKHYRAGEKVL